MSFTRTQTAEPVRIPIAVGRRVVEIGVLGFRVQFAQPATAGRYRADELTAE